jgi:hypothetical protein
MTKSTETAAARAGYQNEVNNKRYVNTASKLLQSVSAIQIINLFVSELTKYAGRSVS